MSKKPLCLGLLWHMHQPDYSNVQTGEIYLPWTRFHAVKDYYDMAALVEAEPGMRVTFNLVPSLMDQLRSYASGSARETYASLTAQDAASLDDRQRSFLLRGYFQLPWNQMLYPYPRFRELLERRGDADERGEFVSALKRYSVRDYRDLQMWFNLCWSGAELRRDPEIAEFFRKGRDFSEADKGRLLEIQAGLIGRILPFYRDLMHRGAIELSVSPYYHPILPLLCDSRSARETLPGLALPELPFSYPADARAQIQRALRRYQEEFGKPAAGLWPSEGSISEPALRLAAEAGLRWLASDEGVLLNSLNKAGFEQSRLSARQKFSAHEFDSTGTCLFFRDRTLSDLIGFTYSQWKAEDAAADFLERLRAVHDNLPDDGRHYIVPVILDGENAWEHYPENGADFFSTLYRGLVRDQRFRTVTFSEFLELEPEREALPSITAGSWIYANLATWIGHREKNQAWQLLSAARSCRASREGNSDAAALEESFREILIAEGSDWFWWYGDDHYSENAADFDALFRAHLRNVYRILGSPYPRELDTPIKERSLPAPFRAPVHTISPTLDGKVTDYFEWLAAGFASPSRSGSMHRGEHYVEKLYFGYDLLSFYLRLDLSPGTGTALPTQASLRVIFVAPREFELHLQRGENQAWSCRGYGGELAAGEPLFAIGKIVEIAVPRAALGIKDIDEVRFFISVLDRERELERFPHSDFLTAAIDVQKLNESDWMV